MMLDIEGCMFLPIEDSLIPSGPSPYVRGGIAMPEELAEARGDSIGEAGIYEAGLELKARSQWAYGRRPFFPQRHAKGRLVVRIATIFVAYFADHLTSYSYTELDLNAILTGPTTQGHHWFGTDFLGRDYFTRVLYGIRTSIRVASIVAIVSTTLGTLIGAAAGDFGSWMDNASPT